MADRLDDLICAFHPGASAMETLAILLLGWIVFGAILTLVGKFFYARILDVPVQSASYQNVDGQQQPKVESPAPAQPKPSISNTERFINTLKSNPPPTLPKSTLSRSRSGSTKSVNSPSAASPNVDLPVVSGPNADCVKWVSSALAWILTHQQAVSDIQNLWKEALNCMSKTSEAETGVSVEFQEIMFGEPPVLNNVFCEVSGSERITVTCDFESRLVLLIRARRPCKESELISDYRIQVERLRGRMNVTSNTAELSAVAKFDGWPEVRLSLVMDNAIVDNDELHLQDIVVETVTSALRSAVLNLNWSRYSDFPRFSRTQNQAEPLLPVHYDSMLEVTNRTAAGRDKKLLVKVVKANNLGMQNGCKEVFCVIEMDEPSQRHQTSKKQDTDSPFWDESFLFDIGFKTEEILFEIYDNVRGREKFLGLGIVGMEELLMNPSQRQIIPLQSRPYENDQISGTLTLEFLFVDPAHIPANLAELHMKNPQSGNGQRIVRRDSYDRATKEESELQFPNGNNGQPAIPREYQPPKRIASPNRSGGLVVHQMPHGGENDIHEYKDPLYGDQGLNVAMGSVPSSLSSKGEEDRSRSRKRNKRTFFRTLKERLSRSKDRSHSVDPMGMRDDSLTRDDPLLRSVSADRATSIPASLASSTYTSSNGQLLAVPGMPGEIDSARSSLSEASGISNSSIRTYVDEASTLVLETMENGTRKHYLIPHKIAEKRKWKKKGTKLHIYGDHVFVARHLPGGSPCQVCGLPLSRRPGKQGYECRDCLLRCHKPCHVKVETLCPNSTVHYMELEIVELAPTDRKGRRF